MTNAPVPDVVRDPARPPRAFRPPEAAGPGRFLFFVLGFATAVFTLFVFALLAEAGDEPVQRQAAVVIPSVAVAYVAYRRMRDGKRWRWLFFTVGGLSLP